MGVTFSKRHVLHGRPGLFKPVILEKVCFFFDFIIEKVCFFFDFIIEKV